MRYPIKPLLTAIIIVVFQLLPIHPLYSQWGFKVGEESKIPSADKWNFINNGEVEANLHTGTINLSIPIYTYQDNDFILPIGINYATNGLMANMRPGILGPDWVLDVGGSITVDIRGMSDLESSDNASNYYEYHQLSNPGTAGSYWRYSNYVSPTVELGAPSPEIIYVPAPGMSIYHNTPKYDAEPDFFHFNFMGYSGTFHLGPNNNIYVYNTSGDNKLHKIEITGVTNGRNIKITDKQGYVYLFSSNDTDEVNGTDGQKRDVAYNLTSITAPNGRVLSFYYGDYYTNSTYRPSSITSTGGVIDFGADGTALDGYHYSEFGVMQTDITTQLLTGIYVDDKRIVEISYNILSIGTKDQYAPSKSTSQNTYREFDECIRLSGIKILNPYEEINRVVRRADFSYVTTQGARTNYLSTVTLTGEGTYSFSYYNMSHGLFPPVGTFSIDHWGYYNGRTIGNFLKIVSTNNISSLDENITSIDRNPNANYAIYGMLQRITYPTGGYSEIEYESHSYGKRLTRTSTSAFLPTLTNESATCGGLRIKSISNHLENGTQINKKSYSYTLPDGGSSGILLYFPKYWLNYSAQGGPYQEININYWSNNLISHNGSHIEYATVTQTNSDNSREVFHFSNSAQSPIYRDEVETGDVINEKVANTGNEWGITSSNAGYIKNIVAPMVSKRAERGKLLKHEIYAAGSNTPSKEIIYGYDTTRSLSVVTYPAYLIRKFGHIPVYTDNYRLISKTEKETNNGTVIIRTESYSYNTKGQLSGITTQSSGGITEITRYTYPYDHLSEGGIFATMNTRNLHGYPVTQTRYVIDGGTEKQIGGKKYSYGTYNNQVKPSVLYNYNPVTGSWDIEQRYTKYSSNGNLLESYDSNNIPTSYIWGYGGQYLVGKGENIDNTALSSYVSMTAPLTAGISDAIAQNINTRGSVLLTTYTYTPMIGITKVRYPDGTTQSYQYNSSGKLLHIINSEGNKQGSSYYSPENKQ